MTVTARARNLLTVATVIVVLASVGGYLARQRFDGRLPLRIGPACTVAGSPATPGGAPGKVSLDPDQMANAATIAAVGIRTELPDRAVVVALATAFQESKLRNLSGGDRDSVGLFQQRPSKGWGTPEQIRDPRYAAGRFYAALRKVRGWESMRVTDAAQKVQRSAFPTAYQKWADESEVLAAALSGRATGAVACTVAGRPAVRGSAAAAALTESLRLDWGTPLTVTEDAPGLAVAVADARAGWQFAHWMVSHAAARGIKRVLFADHAWTAESGGWTRVQRHEAAGDGRVVAEVFGEAGQSGSG